MSENDSTILPSVPAVEGVEIRHIKWLPGYAIGTDGSAWCCIRIGCRPLKYGPWRKMAAYYDRNGYAMIRTSILGVRKNEYIHRVIATIFVGPPPSDGAYLACHNDGDKTNNHPSNLRWDTYQGNRGDMAAHGTLVYGEKSYQSKLTSEIVKKMRATYIPYHPEFGASAMARKYGITSGTAVEAIFGKTWKHVRYPARELSTKIHSRCNRLGHANTSENLLPSMI